MTQLRIDLCILTEMDRKIHVINWSQADVTYQELFQIPLEDSNAM